MMRSWRRKGAVGIGLAILGGWVLKVAAGNTYEEEFGPSPVLKKS